MSARVWLASGVTIQTAGPVVFDPPVKITKSGFYTLNLEGGDPTLEPVADPWWVELEQGLDRMRVWDTEDDMALVDRAEVLGLIERVRDR